MSAMWNADDRIWTRVNVSIFYDGNRYTSSDTIDMMYLRNYKISCPRKLIVVYFSNWKVSEFTAWVHNEKKEVSRF